LVVVALLCVVGFSNNTDLAARLGLNVPQAHGRTDDEGKFSVTFDTLKMRVEGLAEDAFGEVLRNVPTQILLEPRPGIAEILGLGNIGAVWVGLYGYEWKRVTTSGFNEIRGTASGVAIDLGAVKLRPKLTWRCDLPDKEVMIVGEAGDQHVTLVSGTCTAELTFEFDPTQWLQHAKRVTQLPTTPGRWCTWVVVEKADRDQVTRTTYHSDGRVWIEKDREVIPRVPSLPPTAQHGQQFIVKGAGGKEYLYMWLQVDPDRPGEWQYLYPWSAPQEDKPPEEPGEPGESGEPGAG